VATTNKNKVREIRALLPGIDLITLEAWPALAAPDETGRTFEANALQKAKYYAAATGELTVAEDSGLEIDALDGGPGVESARYGGADLPYPEKFARIYDALRSSALAHRSFSEGARFVCALALVKGDRVLFQARGTIEGTIAPAPRGAGGFGYDPIFYYPPHGCTLAEATEEQKSAVSHRGQAFRKLRAFLDKEYV